MAYYTRVFSTTKEVPSLQAVLEELRDRGIELSVDPDSAADLSTPGWAQVELSYKRGNGPIVVECNRDDGSEDGLVREEPAEFAEVIGPPGLSRAKRRVLKHLNETHFIVACQLLSDIDDAGYDANGEFMSYLVRNCNAMIQADGEGFYEGTKVIVSTDSYSEPSHKLEGGQAGAPLRVTFS
jgi:hypothetical protein